MVHWAIVLLLILLVITRPRRQQVAGLAHALRETLLALVIFRIVWGFIAVGTRASRR